MSTQKELTVKELTKRAGNSTFKKYGKDHYSHMGKKGAQSREKKYGKGYYSRIRRGEKVSQDAPTNQ